MKCPDLPPYARYGDSPLDSVKCIGWLDNYPFPLMTRHSEAVIDNLWRIIGPDKGTFDAHANKVRCIRRCQFCGREIDYVKLSGKPGVLGMSEIWIPASEGDSGQDAAWYVAPSLIVHFMEVHGYSPPDCFLDAILRFDFLQSYQAQEICDALRGLPR